MLGILFFLRFSFLISLIDELALALALTSSPRPYAEFVNAGRKKMKK